MLLKSLLFQNRIRIKLILSALTICGFNSLQSQIANYVTNGGFEEHYQCNGSDVLNFAKGWRNLDSSNCCVFYYSSSCNSLVPVQTQNYRYQWAYKGGAFASTAFLCYCPPMPNRGYFRNRLKGKLETGKTYCVKFYVNLVNNSNYAIDTFGAYFGDNSLDTITKGTVRITYLQPQVENQLGNYITDTLNWSLITGTFTAAGTEKFMVIGNFKSDATTGKILVNQNNGYIFSDLNIDHVSCIDIDLPVFAGHDTSCIPGTTIYLGRQRDVGIDEACKWYKLPITITPTTPAIDTAAGIWVSPTQTSTYVVRQEICGNVKWDTVIVYKDGVGLQKLSVLNTDLKIFPIPANESIELLISNTKLFSEYTTYIIYNNLGQTVREEDILFDSEKTNISTTNLPNGIYTLKLRSINSETINKRFVISR